MRLTSSLDGVSPAQLQGFFEGWPHPPSPETLHRLLAGSYRIALAVEEDGAGSPVSRRRSATAC